VELFSLHGRRALITGSSRGIGWQTAQMFAAAGAKVVLNGRDDKTLAERRDSLLAQGHDADIVAFDVSDPDQVVARCREFIDRTGPIDILVSNAGAPFRKSLADTSLDDWRQVMDSHVASAFALAQLLAPTMATNGHGRIIIMSSLMGSVSRPNNTAYSAAKAAINGLVRALAAELGADGITCNAIAPGWILTDATQNLHEDPEWDNFIVGRNALKRWGRPEEIAAAALFLAADSGAFVTGQVLTVDGGLSAIV